jgi:hypothetical protein
VKAIQFEAVVENDSIRIPEQYRNTVHRRKVRVTLLPDHVREPVDKTKAGTLTLNDFTELQLPTKGFKFDREEANARR